MQEEFKMAELIEGLLAGLVNARIRRFASDNEADTSCWDKVCIGYEESLVKVGVPFENIDRLIVELDLLYDR